MSRRDTMLEDFYRVHIVRPDGTVVSGSSFRTVDGARAYYDALYFPGHRKELQRRPAGKSRYETIEQESMVTG